MSEAAPQTADGTGTEDIAKGLGVLRLLWEDEYLIGHDDDLGWWASRRGVIGHLITANSPEDLGQMIGDDFGPGRRPASTSSPSTPVVTKPRPPGGTA